MMVTLTNGRTVETGCYVDGHWGWRGLGHMIDQASGILDAELARPTDDADGFDPDYAAGCADEAEDALNAVTPDGFLWHWRDGEFFLSPYCGGEGEPDDDHDPTCACWG